MATGLDIVDLLTRVGVNYSEVDVAAHSWRRRQLATLLPSSPASDPAMTMPQVFLSSSTHIGGNEELRAFHDSGELRRSLEELKGAQTPEFPPPFLEPSKEELLACLPPRFVEQWTAGLGSLDAALGAVC
ncbi:hypothetical protein TrLO_g12002 [Triparma laevis f. longispina]|uniref:Uncharacterized protein n=1 Tax=Triparma laevis f. longispina TaxID=1714387 RepID=A0A9W7CAS1_9STRA|nr:hypothetical protein TrLO_g12002 [Triparma laevis f. longispina]